MICLHFVAFLCIFWNKPINKMPQCQFLFSGIFLFQVFTEGNILRIGQNKSQSAYLSDMKTESKGETETSQEPATPGGGAAQPLAAPPHGVGPSGAHRPRPCAYKFTSSRKP
jgi:hypothetical protein